MTKPLFEPSEERVEESILGTWLAERGDDYNALHDYSVRDTAAFWEDVAETCGLAAHMRTANSTTYVPSENMWDATFFNGATLNFVDVVLAGNGAASDADMFIEYNESGFVRRWTRADVRAEVAALRGALQSYGVGRGDRVAAWMPNTAYTAIALLATSSLGAIFCSTSPDFGTDGVLDRFAQIEPKVLIASNAYLYNNKVHDCEARLHEICAGLPTLNAALLINNVAKHDPSPAAGPRSELIVGYETAVSEHRGSTLTFDAVDFNDPIYILFSSGTTGQPKCIVHRTGGVLLQHLKEHQLHCDIRIGDRAMYYTTCGWMMWNWLVSIPASGAAVVLYDGSPFAHGPATLWNICENEMLTMFGISAKFLETLRNEGYEPQEHHDLGEVRTMTSTGSPLTPEVHSWTQGCLGNDVHIASISGGTDLCSCFVLGDPTSSVYPGEIQRAGLGMDVCIVDEQGTPCDVGVRGELVCATPFPSMPLRFWDDPNNEKYHNAYFANDAGVWNHGDFASWTEHGGIVVHGRSDTTLNPGGVRIGTAEIYRRVDHIEHIVESLVFGQDTGGDVRIVLLVVLEDGHELTDERKQHIRTEIRTGCSPRHVPAVIAPVADLPRTRSGKLAELAVKDAVAGREIRNTTALANPECIAAIVGHPALSL